MSVPAIAVLLSAGTVVCTIHLLIGYWLGRSQVPPGRLGWGEVESLVRPQLAAARLVFEHAERATAANGGQSPFSSELTVSISELIAATRVLERRLNTLSDAALPAEAPPRGEHRCSASAGDGPAREPRSPNVSPMGCGTAETFPCAASRMLSEAELASVTMSAGVSTLLPPKNGHAPRYRYQAVRRMAPCDSAYPPAAGDLRPVQCHEISVEGIAVFLEEAPEFDRFAIHLGDGETGPLMLCQIEGMRAVYMYGRHGFVVDARFQQRSAGAPCLAETV